MDVNARLRATWRGDVSGADLVALFAAMESLRGAQQALETRRLAAEVEHTGHEWRVFLAIGPVAAPLWLADALKSLAEAFYAAETDAHPERPSTVSAYTHDLVAALLTPVEDLLAEATAMLADPNHPSPLVAPLHVGPGGDIADGEMPRPLPLPYAQGLLSGATRVHTAASSALLALRTDLATADPPDWLTTGIERLDGTLQAAGARLDISERRLASQLATRRNTQRADPVALDGICRDLWSVVDVAVVAGQLLADPHLLPEAVTAVQAGPSQSSPTPSSSSAPEAPATDVVRMRPPTHPPVHPAPSVGRREEQAILPRIDTGAAPLTQRRFSVSHVSQTPSETPVDVEFPTIGGTTAPADTPPAEPERPTRPPLQRPRVPGPEHDDAPPPMPFPEIG